jgi:glycosyltransferase involved in cell wall biosynthesis
MQYTEDLLRAGRKLRESGAPGEAELLDPLYFDPLDSSADASALAEAIARRSPDLVHFQHEFGFMGSKTPVKYRFPSLVRDLRKRLPSVRIVATAHTVLTDKYAYPWRGRGVQAPFRLAANWLLLPILRQLWIQRSWGPLDGVAVHSSHQLATARSSGCAIAREIPHYVPQEEKVAGSLPKTLKPIPPGAQVLLVFGYFTPEKAQDVAIRAMGHLSNPAYLVLAGGIRREQDRAYFETCQGLIRELELEDRVQVTGFVTFEELSALVDIAQLVLLPFRETSGSGSLADLFARAAPILASDLPLNLEIAARAPGALRFFRSEDPAHCAREIQALFSDPSAIAELKKGARKYADLHSPEAMMARHFDFYGEVLRSPRVSRA